MLTTVEFERFATSRSDDGLGLKNNPLDAGVLALIERHKKDYAAFVDSVTLSKTPIRILIQNTKVLFQIWNLAIQTMTFPPT